MSNLILMKRNFLYSILPVIILSCIWITAVSQETSSGSVKISGTIVSIVDNTPMQGVNVRIDGVAGAFQETDENGKFSIDVLSYQVTMLFSYPGFIDYSMFLGERPELLVKMIPENHPSSLDQVVLIPGSVRQKRFTTQSYESLNESDFTGQSYATMERYMYGKVAGMNVTAVNGMPGAATSMNIRGISSMFTGSQPLYIIDGIEISSIEVIRDLYNETLNTQLYNSRLVGLNVNDIASVTVLKDAAAKAVYGSRAGNGVIIIETAKGEKGNSRIDLNITQGVDFKGKDITMLNANENRQYLMEMANSQYGPGKVIDNFGQALFNDPSSLVYEAYNNDTNWPNLIQKNSAYFGDYHIRLRGGDDVAKYTLSVGMLDKKGILENNDMNKMTARFNLDYDVSEWLRIGTNLYFTRLMQNRSAMGFSSYNPLLLAYQKSPITAPYVQDKRGVDTPIFEDYDIFGVSNPLALSNLNKNEFANNHVGGKIFGEFRFNNEFSGYISAGLNNQTAQDKMFIPKLGVVPMRDMFRISEQTYVEDLLFDGRLEFIYHKKISEIHYMNVTLGGNILDDQASYRLGRSYNSTSDDFTKLDQGQIDYQGSFEQKWRMLAAYLQGNYMFKERYIADLAMRVDGSSRFGLNNRAIFYPAIGLAWRISQENFMNTITWIDELKLRFSTGYSGNDNIGNYTARLLYLPGNYKDLSGFTLGQVANDQLKPEKLLEHNLGIDMGIFNQRVNLTLNIYDRTTTNMLLPTNQPSESGAPVVLMNSGKVNNRGIEAGLGINFRTGDFAWNVGGNIAYNKNKVTKMPESTPTVVSHYDIFAAMAVYGQPMGVYYGFQTNGVFATDEEAASYAQNGRGYQYETFKGGDVRFIDQNTDDVIDDKDMVYLGKSMPDVTGGAYFSVSWKGITLGASMDMQLGREVVNGMRYKLEAMKDYSNQTIAVNRRWQQSGDVTDMPRLAYNDPAGNSRFSDRWIEDGSFVRLRNVSLSYDLPANYLQKIWFKKLKVFVNVDNVLTYSKYLGFDPEFNHLNSDFISGIDAASLYIPRSLTVGLCLGF